MNASFPDWLVVLSTMSLIVAGSCSVVVVFDEFRHPQKMWIMNLVWPLTTLFGGILWLAAYWIWGRADPGGSNTPSAPFPSAVLKGSSHCGAGCTLGDLIAEWVAYAFPGVAVLFGWHTLFDNKTFAVWILDFVLAFILGVGFQYFTIKPMRHLSVRAGLMAALKADIASISAWQVGMYVLMAAIQFGWFRTTFGGLASVASPEFWFAMQIAMLGGFATSYPVNWLLIRAGWKEEM
jgi:hypothetical protein